MRALLIALLLTSPALAQKAAVSSLPPRIAIGTVTTGAPGSNAAASIGGTVWAPRLNLTIPRGDTGATGQGVAGPAGTNGTNGTNGSAATISIGTVTTGAAGSSATVTNAGTSGAAVFNFTIPRGTDGAAGATGATGPAGLGTVTPATPARALNTAFQISATKAAFACYSIALSVTNPLLIGTSTAQVQLLSDSATTPTTLRATAAIGSGVGVTVTLALTTTNTIPVCYMVPAGHYVRLVSSTSGTGSATIAAQTEETLG